jgi:hypothetical protein
MPENSIVTSWSFKGFSRFDLVLRGGLTKGGDIEVKAPSSFWSDPGTLACMGLDETYNGPHPIAGGSGDVVCDSRVIDMAPHTPQRSERPGKPGALL